MTPRTLVPLEAGRAAWGAALLLAPHWALSQVHRTPPDPLGVAVLRVLGVRHLAQAIALTATPAARSPHASRAAALGASVDALHALSMVPVALTGGRYVRAGRTEVVVASAWALLETVRASR